MRILAISGSLRRDSHNTALLRAAANLLPSGVELAIHDGLRDIPPFDEDALGEIPAAVQRLRDEISAADGVLVSTPEYNSSIPGQLKNALDWLSRPLVTSPLRKKPTAVIGASTGMFGAVWAQAEARKVLSAIGASVLDRELPVPNVDEQFHPDGTLNDEDVEAALVEVIEALVGAIGEKTASIAA
ncbi:MAG: NAD(P)H-dependent oxidoreductase [Solirubrobacterales bacterium]|jgi:chromate reductase|nr:NAD(P)H-dependent oxidoreductase [Solirubrobacterales bacterium]